MKKNKIPVQFFLLEFQLLVMDLLGFLKVLPVVASCNSDPKVEFALLFIVLVALRCINV